ncbi:hypothetical protein BV378_25780 [Nostoc sp. RF31YmG]|nr:hypothetical protein BV378_25780 [Nostoc sp. RF31YmG]
MPRSVRAKKKYQQKILDRLHGQFYNQQDLADHLVISQSTVSKFVNLIPIDRSFFINICEALGIEWRDIAASPLDTEADDEAIADQNGISSQPTSLTPSHLPSPHLEYPEGQMALTSRFYIERPPIEKDCFQQISQPAALISIQAPQKMGKSSLLARIIQQAKNQGDFTVIVNFQLAEEEFFTNLSKFLRWFCNSVILELTRDNQELQIKLLKKLDEHWFLAERIGSKIACKDYFERYLFSEISQPLTLALEKADILFEYPTIYRDFFGLLRSLHDEGRIRDIWQKLRLVIVHSTEAYVPLDINQSPFNVGLPVELPEFNSEQVLDLAQRHQLNWQDKEVQQLKDMVGGHPFLVRLALYKIARQERTLAQLLQTAPTAAGIYSNHLHHLESILIQQPELGAAIKEVVTATTPVRLNTVVRSKLRALGLVKLQGDEVTPSCELYRKYFQNF